MNLADFKVGMVFKDNRPRKAIRWVRITEILEDRVRYQANYKHPDGPYPVDIIYSAKEVGRFYLDEKGSGYNLVWAPEPLPTPPNAPRVPYSIRPGFKVGAC